MAEAKNAPRLSTLGTTKPSQGSSVGTSPFVGRSQINDERRLQEVLAAQIQELASSETESPLKRILTNPAALAMLLGGGAAAAFGGDTGKAIGAGIGMGGLQGAQSQAQQERQAKIDQAEKMLAQREKSMGREEKARQRIATAFNTNPDAFIDPLTNVGPPPAELGYAITGSDQFPMYADSQRIYARRLKEWEEQVATVMYGIKNSTDPAEVARLTSMHLDLIGFKGTQEERDTVVSGLASTVGTDKFDTAVHNMLMNQFGASGLRAIRYKHEKKVEWDDPALWRLVTPSPKSSQVDDEKKAKAAKFLKYADQWELDNPELVQQIYDAAATPQLAQEAVILAAAKLSGVYTGNDSAGLAKTLGFRTPQLMGPIASARKKVAADGKFARTTTIGAQITSAMGKTPEQLDAEDLEKASQEVDNQIAMQREKSGMALVTSMTTTKNRILAILPGHPLAGKMASDIVLEALAASQKPDGTMDVARYEAVINAKIKEIEGDNK